MTYGKLYDGTGGYKVISKEFGDDTWYIIGDFDSEGNADLIIEALEARGRNSDG